MATLAFSNWAIAEPNATLRYLMKEPVTMLEWGFMQLRKDLDGLDVPEVGNIEVKVGLDWDKSQIKIFGHSFKRADNSKQVKKWCANTIHILRARLGLDVETGEPLIRGKSVLALYFSHDGYASRNQPKSLGQELDNITVLEGSFLWFQQGKEGVQEIRCQAPLLGTEVMYSE